MRGFSYYGDTSTGGGGDVIGPRLTTQFTLETHSPQKLFRKGKDQIADLSCADLRNDRFASDLFQCACVAAGSGRGCKSRKRRSRERAPFILERLFPVYRLSQKVLTMSAREGWWCPRCGSFLVLGSNRTSSFDRCGFETYRIVCKRCETLLIAVIDPADDAPLISEFESAASQSSARLGIKKT